MAKVEENWKPIPENPRFQISDLGRIRGRKGLLMNPHLAGSPANYLAITIQKEDKKLISRLVHRLVARAFIPNPENYREVNHKDLDKQNNFASNLEWCSRIENMQHAVHAGRIIRGEQHRSSKFTNEQVLSLRELYRRNPKLNMSQLARQCKVAEATIWRLLMRQSWTHI